MYERKMKNAYITNFSVVTYDNIETSPNSHVITPTPLKKKVISDEEEKTADNRN